MSDNYDNSSDSSHPQPKKTVDESHLNPSQAKNTVVEPNPSKTPRTPLARKDPLEGKTIGDNNRYLLQTLLGQGGMSKVYRALDTKFEDRKVAIKLMTNYSATSGKHLIKRFMAEIKAISRLKHINIIQILDFGVTPALAPFSGSPFYVMEYFAGKTLQNLLTENRTIPLDSLSHIIRQVCAGLKEAHQKGIVHRDLKPDNIFLVAGGAFGEIVKIIDFGIAKNISADDQKSTQLTREGSFIGTYRYASPEQCRGLLNIDQRTDIYSLGVILYEAICGQNPYNLDNDVSSSQADWIACHLRVPPKPLKEQPGCENIKDELANIVMKCLAKSPQDRFSDIGELQNAFTNSFLVRMKGNYDSESAPKITNNLGKKSHHFKIKAEAKQVTNKTVVETTNNNSFQKFINSEGKKLSVGLLAGVTAVLMGVIGTGVYSLLNQPKNNSNLTAIPSDNNTQEAPNTNNIISLLETLETQHQQKNYQDCYKLATGNPNQDNIGIKEWIGKCGLEAAKIKAKANSYSEAIAIAQKIPNTVSNYQNIQDSINNWSGKILDYATKVYKQGNLEEAVKITQIIPDNSNLKATLPELISKWSQEEEKHQNIIDNAQNLLARAQWYGAKQEVEKISTDFVFWRQEAQPILDKANQQINAIAAAEQRRREQAAAEQRRREQAAAEQRPREQAAAEQRPREPTPLHERLKNVPLLPDDYVKRRLQRRH